MSAQPLMLRPGALLWFYRRRLRVHAVQELLAGVGVAVAVAMAFATIVAAGSVAGSAREVVNAVIGPASLQLHSLSPEGFPETALARVERLQGVRQAAPLLEQTATLEGPHGRAVTVDLAGADTSLVVLDGLAHTLPRATLSSGGIGLSRASAQALGLRGGQGGYVTLKIRGRAQRLRVSAVLGPETFGALAQAQVAVMPLEDLQRVAGMQGRITRILVATRGGQDARVRRELAGVSGGRMQVARADQDVGLLRQALRPSDQASAFFATVSALLGLLLAFNALLITVPERRRAVADLRLIGVKRTAIAQMLVFQALLLGAAASLAGLLGGYALSLHALHQSTRYLAEAFTLGTHTLVTAQPLAIALCGGMLATFLASAVPLLDLRAGAALDAVYHGRDVPGNALPAQARGGLALATCGLLVAASVLFALDPARALLACALLALAAVLAVPPVFGGVLYIAQSLCQRWERLTVLPVALNSLRSTTLRSLALASTGAVALFGSVALGGARGDLLGGIERFSHSYSSEAGVWVGTPGDNQASVPFQAAGLPARIAALPGVTGVQQFQGGFLELGGRRVWVLSRPAGAAQELLETQAVEGDARRAAALIAHGGWIALSAQIATQQHTRAGGALALPTPSGTRVFRVAATTTNLAWSPGAVLVGASDYRRLWGAGQPTALAVALASGASRERVQTQINTLLGPSSGLRATGSIERERSIDALTGEGLGQLGEISTLLLIAAVLAMAAALTSALWQRRSALAGLRLAGVRPRRLRAILLVESGLMLGAGCVVGIAAGVYGQLAIDGYLSHVTGFPVAGFAASTRPLEVLGVVGAAVLAIVAVPGWIASRVSPTLALAD